MLIALPLRMDVFFEVAFKSLEDNVYLDPQGKGLQFEL
jgi:hypothetical protein